MTVEIIEGREAWVKLGALELLLGAIVGIHRAVEVILAGRQNRARGLDDDGNVWTRQIEGAIAEEAVAHAVDRFWGGAGAIDRGRITAPKPTGGDVGRLQVRLRIASPYDQNKRLIVQQRDDPSEDFVLVVGRAPTYRVVGWINAGEAKRHPEWIANPGNYGEAWFVPQASLRDLKEIAA